MTRAEFISNIEREQKSLRGFLLALCCGNKSDADDLVQDTLVKAYISSVDYRDKGKFKSWLFKIAYNTFINNKKYKHSYENISMAQSLVDNKTADASFKHENLYLALNALPPKERSVITLFYLTGYSINEISLITETTVDAVKKQLQRSRDKLKEKLKI